MDEKQVAIDIWRDVFGDSEEYIASFYRAFPESFLLHKSGQAMLHLLPVNIEGERGSCLYAAATLREARGRGYMRELVEEAKELCRARRDHFIVLYPAEKDLYSFYEKLGFSPCHGGEEKPFFLQEQEGEGEACPPRQYFALRRTCIDRPYVEWPIRALRFMEEDGVFYRNRSGSACGYYSDGKIGELVGEPTACWRLAQYILKEQGRTSVVALMEGNQPYGMICPLDETGLSGYQNCFISLNME